MGWRRAGDKVQGRFPFSALAEPAALLERQRALTEAVAARGRVIAIFHQNGPPMRDLRSAVEMLAKGSNRGTVESDSPRKCWVMHAVTRGLQHARGGTRTRTAFSPRDFKSLASTDFATRA